MKLFIFFFRVGMNSIYITILKSLASPLLAILRAEAKKSTTEIDDKLVTILESILKEFKIIG